MVKYYYKINGKLRIIVEWIIYGFYERENFVILVLNSLVMRGILVRELKLFGRKYLIVDFGMIVVDIFKYFIY